MRDANAEASDERQRKGSFKSAGARTSPGAQALARERSVGAGRRLPAIGTVADSHSRWQAASDIPTWIWWPHVERIFMAVDDLGCRDLLA